MSFSFQLDVNNWRFFFCFFRDLQLFPCTPNFKHLRVFLSQNILSYLSPNVLWKENGKEKKKKERKLEETTFVKIPDFCPEKRKKERKNWQINAWNVSETLSAFWLENTASVTFAIRRMKHPRGFFRSSFCTWGGGIALLYPWRI